MPRRDPEEEASMMSTDAPYKRTPRPTVSAYYGAVGTIGLSCALFGIMVYTLREYVAAKDASLLTWASFALHPLLMTLAFGVLAPVGIISWRAGEDMLGKSHSAAKTVHGMLMGGAAVVGVIGVADMWTVHEKFAAAQVAKGWAVHFQSAHGVIGIVALALFVLNWLGGLGIFSALSAASGMARRAYKPTHAFLGAMAAALSILSVITGILSLAGRGDNAAPKDVLFKTAALLAALLMPSIALVFTYSRSAEDAL